MGLEPPYHADRRMQAGAERFGCNLGGCRDFTRKGIPRRFRQGCEGVTACKTARFSKLRTRSLFAARESSTPAGSQPGNTHDNESD
jgi:hypothetical protein